MDVGKMRNLYYGMRNAEGKMRNGPEWNVRNINAEWWVICGMQKVALSAGLPVNSSHGQLVTGQLVTHTHTQSTRHKQAQQNHQYQS